MKDIFLSGIQWSWKWTQANLILENFPNQFTYFETWSVLRALSSNDNAIWNYLKNTVESWKLVKDEVTVAIVNVFLLTVEKKNRLLFDWTLRKLKQTQLVCEKLKKAWRDFVVLHFDLPDEIVYERLAARIVCSHCWDNAKNWTVWWKCEKCGWELVRRKDDENLDAIKNRIEAFHKDTMPAIKRVEEQWRLVRIDANRSIEEIFADILKYIQ